LHKTIAALIGTMTLLGALAIGTPALASGGNCNPSGVCFYDTASSASPFFDYDGGDNNGYQCLTFPSGYQARASYVNNRSSHKWIVYTNTTCSGTTSSYLYANTQGTMSGIWNNSIRSMIW
jgi:hypothetical protein